MKRPFLTLGDGDEESTAQEEAAACSKRIHR